MERMGQNLRRHVCFIQFARWRGIGGDVYVSDCILCIKVLDWRLLTFKNVF